MDDQIILACNDNGKFIGEYIKKDIGHTGKGKKHLAITVLVFNSKDEVLLQKRKHKVFDNIWDMSASTHPLHREDGTDETNEDATKRALKDEYGIEKVKEIKELGAINYFAEYGEFCENEYDFILIAKYDGEIKLNKDVAYDYKWVKKQKFLKDIQENPDKYSPWAKEAVKVIEKKGFFNE